MTASVISARTLRGTPRDPPGIPAGGTSLKAGPTLTVKRVRLHDFRFS